MKELKLNVGELSSLQLNGFYSYFILGLILQRRPKVIFEIGMGESAQTACLALQALNFNKECGFPGKFISLDIEYKKETLNKLQPYIEENNFEYIIGSSQDVFNYKNVKGPVDMVLIDAEHSYNNIINEVNHVFVANIIDPINGIFVFHDINFAPVLLAINDLTKQFNFQTFFFTKDNIAISRLKCHSSLESL